VDDVARRWRAPCCLSDLGVVLIAESPLG
jgi:hypothetical protein